MKLKKILYVNEKKNLINKYIKNYHNTWSDLSPKDAFNLEKETLEVINKNYECICCSKKNHFPILNDYDEKNLKLQITHCGISIEQYDNLLKFNLIKKRKIINKEEQIDCIIHNLKKSKIYHLDMKLNGKNLCFNKEGVLSVIDFDIACIDNNFKTEKLKMKYDKFCNKDEDYYVKLKNVIKLILIKK